MRSIIALVPALVVLGLVVGCGGTGPSSYEIARAIEDYCDRFDEPCRGQQGEEGERGDPGPRGDDGLPGQQGAQGDTGSQGQQGQQGPPGQDGYPMSDDDLYINEASTSCSAGSYGCFLNISCDSGPDFPISGGCSMASSGALWANYPVEAAGGFSHWHCRATNNVATDWGAGPMTTTLTGFVVCVDVP